LLAIALRNARRFGTIAFVVCTSEMFLPLRKIGSQPVEVEIRERLISARKIPNPAVQNRAGSGNVSARFVMKGDCQLNQSLQMPALRRAAWRFAPRLL